jgi:hypothetical protein
MSRQHRKSRVSQPVNVEPRNACCFDAFLQGSTDHGRLYRPMRAAGEDESSEAPMARSKTTTRGWSPTVRMLRVFNGTSLPDGYPT